ncbi:MULTISPECIES: hypothetical protein [unclassified Candidatus Tisiphia]|jgi:hypothetical protein|uniref:hypothetical protein n=1 Tax=unclassified Candidatus Tisiphia TaxID=2996318 RepID=UPI003CCAC697
MLKVLLPKDIDWSKVDIWSQDETRIGQQGSLSRIWAKRGSRPRKVSNNNLSQHTSMELLAMIRANLLR